MAITLNWQTIITASAVLAAVIAIVVNFAKVVRWVDKQKQQDHPGCTGQAGQAAGLVPV